MEFDVTVNNEEGGYAEFKVADMSLVYSGDRRWQRL